MQDGEETFSDSDYYIYMISFWEKLSELPTQKAF